MKGKWSDKGNIDKRYFNDPCERLFLRGSELGEEEGHLMAGFNQIVGLVEDTDEPPNLANQTGIVIVSNEKESQLFGSMLHCD